MQVGKRFQTSLKTALLEALVSLFRAPRTNWTVRSCDCTAGSQAAVNLHFQAQAVHFLPAPARALVTRRGWLSCSGPALQAPSATLAPLWTLEGQKEGWGTMRHTFLINSWNMINVEGHTEGIPDHFLNRFLEPARSCHHDRN